MLDDKEYEMIECMQKYGGSFARALAECLLRADPTNYQKLKRAFPEYILEYTEMAKRENEEK